MLWVIQRSTSRSLPSWQGQGVEMVLLVVVRKQRLEPGVTGLCYLYAISFESFLMLHMLRTLQKLNLEVFYN
jgi:hypothetical protein